MLKMLTFKKQTNKQTNKKIKNKKQYMTIIYYECKLTFFSRDDTKQAKSHFHCGSSSRTSSKSTKINK